LSDAQLDDTGLPHGYAVREAFEISPMDARRLLDVGGAILIDCRTEEEWEIARVAGAELVPLSEIEDRADEIEADEHTPVLVMCHLGIRSARAALALQRLGFPRARSIVGGIEAWSRAIDPSVPRYARVRGGCQLL